MSLTVQGRQPRFAALVNRASVIFVSRGFGLALTILAICAGAVTYAAAAGLLPPKFSSRHLFGFLLTADLVIVGFLAVLVTVRLVDAWQQRRRGEAGSRLHVRLVLFFSLFAVAPTFLLAIMSPYFFQVLQDNLLGPARSGLAASSDIMRAGLAQQQAAIQADLGELAAALQQLTPTEIADPAHTLPV